MDDHIRQCLVYCCGVIDGGQQKLFLSELKTSTPVAFCLVHDGRSYCTPQHSVPRGGKNYFRCVDWDLMVGLSKKYGIFLTICKKNQVKSSFFRYFMVAQSQAPDADFIKKNEI